MSKRKHLKRAKQVVKDLGRTPQDRRELLDKLYLVDMTPKRIEFIELMLIKLTDLRVNEEEARCVFIFEQLYHYDYGKPTKVQKAAIDELLQKLSSYNSKYLGIDKTKADKKEYKRLEAEILAEIKQIHEGYYRSIQVQNEQ